jgi:hypothetical protein
MHLAIEVSTRKTKKMHFTNLIILSDFMQVLNSIKKYPTKNEHFPMNNLFTAGTKIKS